MSYYIPPIKNPEAMYSLRIKRFDPEKDDLPRFIRYEIPFVKTMTVMEALEYLGDQGDYVAFRANCREFTCGSCAMLINGKPGLACETLLEDGMTLEPLSRFPLVKDLVVDTSAVKRKIEDIKYWPVRAADQAGRELTVDKETVEEFNQVFSRCIECYCCLEACPASASELSAFDGPMYLLLLARAARHPLDKLNRLDQAAERGMWCCVSCFECADVCPVNLSPGREIAKLRSRAVRSNLSRLFGRKRGI